MKQISTILNSILACALILVLASIGLPSFNVQAAPLTETSAEPMMACNTERSIQVSGTAVVNVTPDRVLIQLGVQSNSTSPQRVEKANSTTINQVIRALKAQGIKEKDIVTDWYVIKPIYDDYDSLHIKGYRIDNMVAVTLRDLSKVNAVIIAALNARQNRP